MITSDEIQTTADELDIHPANVERDYVFGWLLKAIYENSYLREILVFKGGNCFRKAFYPGSRYSSDLDFSISGIADQPRLLAAINDACLDAQRLCGVEFLTQRNTLIPRIFSDNSRTVYKGRIFFNDFLGEEDGLTISINVDVVEMDRLFLHPVMRQLSHPYSDVSQCAAEIKCMALEELIALKLKCLIQRRHSPDLFDLVYATFVDKSIDVDTKLILKVFLSKTIFGNNPGAAKEILSGLPMKLFDGMWGGLIDAPRKVRFGFDRAVEGFRSSIGIIFDGIGNLNAIGGQFFPSEQRNLIMTAGAERKLLRLKYGGVERLIEPYSLSYKQAQGRMGREYFYAYDRTGGQRSGPDIKSFVSSNVEKLELTDEEFEPRFEIELSKSGEKSGKSHFGRNFKGSRAPVLRTFLQRSTSKFKLQCPYCQKIFPRTTRDMTLREHKSPDGYRCGGRRGFWV